MPVASPRCPACGAALPETARFCPDCGLRTAGSPGGTAIDLADETAINTAIDTAIEEVPPTETGPVPVHVLTVEPRWFGVVPATAVLLLGLVVFGLAVFLLVRGETLAGALLVGAAVVLVGLFVAAAMHRPDGAVARASAGAVGAMRMRAGLAVESLAAQGSAHVEFIRVRRELGDLGVRRALSLQALGEAVYRDDEGAADEARGWVRALEGEIAAKEARMETIVANANERITRARLEVQPTEIRTPQAFDPPGPAPVPEPTPEPSPPIEPPMIPEPTPEPSPPVEPPMIPEPTPEPTEPTPTIEQGEGA